MFKVILYEDSLGRSQVGDFIKDMKEKGENGRNTRINYTKIVAYIRLLRDKGTSVGMPIMRYLKDGIWELRPVSYRILFAFIGGNRYLLLHYFRKTTNRTPQREIDKAKKELEDYLGRENGNEDVGRI